MKLDGDSIHVGDDLYNLRSQYRIYKKESIMFEVKQDNEIKGKSYFVYKIINCSIRDDILDV